MKKKDFITGLLLMGMAAAAAFAYIQITKPQDSSNEKVAIGSRCMRCNGSGFDGNWDCFSCKGTGRNGSY